MNYLPEPITRVERYLARIAGNTDVSIPEKPITRKEHYLAAWAEKSTFQDVTVTGNPAVLDNATGKPFRDLHIYGRSEQKITNGYQLIDHEKINASETTNGVTYTNNGDGSITVNGTATKNAVFEVAAVDLQPGTYRIRCDDFSDSGKIFCAALIANSWTNALVNSTFTIQDETLVHIKLVVNEGNTARNIIARPILSPGTGLHEFEPYTGGKPSPSPDYPQEIVNAGKDGNLNVMVRGKNLISPNIEWGKAGWGGTVKNTEGVVIANAVNGWGVFAFHSPAVGKTVTLSITYRQIETTSDDTEDAFAVATLPSIAYPKSGTLYTTMSPKTEESKINVTFTSDEYIGVLIRVSKEGVGLMRKVELRDIQLEESSKPTAYEPYHEPQSMSVTTPNGLPGIPVTSGGNYTDENGQQWICDEVDFGRGVYVQRIKEFHFAPSGFMWNGSTSEAYNIFYWDAKWHDIIGLNYGAVSSRFFRWDNAYKTDNTFRAVLGGLRIRMDSAASLDDFKAKFPDGIDVLCPISTPIETPLTASEIAAYKSLRTYRGTTIVEAEDKAGVSATYTKFKERSI